MKNITKKVLIIFIGLAFVSSCGSIMQSSQNTIQNTDETLVFIHGIKGGVLADKRTGDTAWITVPQALGVSTPNLKLPLQWSDADIPQQAKDNLIAVSPVDRLTLIPNIIDIKIYNGILTEGAKKYKNFYPFGYDWRRSNLDSLDDYLKFLRKIVAKHHKPVKVIAHSMGGLLTMAAMQADPELFDTVFFVGTPFAGGVGFLDDLHQGVSTGTNSKILSPEVVASMPSTYSLFPLEAKAELSDGKNPIKVDFFNPKDWEDLKIGPFAYDFAYNDQFRNHFTKALKVAKIFRQKLFNGKLVKNGERIAKQPKVYVIRGTSLTTLVQVVKNGPQSKLGWDFKSAAKEGGDGLVSAKDAYPPKGIDYTIFESKFQHGDQLNEPAVLKWIFEQI
ncbi:MAG: hypothetical protein H7263_07985 [Candidatus Sericytochromatia bacterium]|nr:hypothetical protein [Candidatus Sericytochromatia bacterium]